MINITNSLKINSQILEYLIANLIKHGFQLKKYGQVNSMKEHF